MFEKIYWHNFDQMSISLLDIMRKCWMQINEIMEFFNIMICLHRYVIGNNTTVVLIKMLTFQSYCRPLSWHILHITTPWRTIAIERYVFINNTYYTTPPPRAPPPSGDQVVVDKL